VSNPKVFGQGSLTLRDRLEGDLILARTEWMGSGFLGIHSPRCSLKDCHPGAMKTAFGAHEQLGRDGKSIVSVTARPDLFEMLLFPPKRWSRKVRRAVVFVAK